MEGRLEDIMMQGKVMTLRLTDVVFIVLQVLYLTLNGSPYRQPETKHPHSFFCATWQLFDLVAGSAW